MRRQSSITIIKSECGARVGRSHGRTDARTGGSEIPETEEEFICLSVRLSTCAFALHTDRTEPKERRGAFGIASFTAPAFFSFLLTSFLSSFSSPLPSCLSVSAKRKERMEHGRKEGIGIVIGFVGLCMKGVNPTVFTEAERHPRLSAS